MKSRICYIIGACNDSNIDFTFAPDSDKMIIAADGGYDFLKSQNVIPDILIGDFDSIEEIPVHPNIIRHPKKKDDTDTFLAYKTAFQQGYRNFVILGGVGGRTDHTIANVQMLLNIAKNAGRGFLIGKDSVMTAIFNNKIAFSRDYKGNIGVFAQGGIAENVCISGLKYSVDNIVLSPDIPMGVSNEFVGKSSVVSVGNGSLLLVWDEKYCDFINHIKDFLL